MSIRVGITICFLTVGIALSLVSGDCLSQDSKTSDETLVSMVKKAHKLKVKPEKIEAFVKVKATLNTTRKGDRHAFKGIRWSSDTQSELPQYSDIKEIVTWNRPIKSENQKIVGIVWLKDGKTELILATVGPP